VLKIDGNYADWMVTVDYEVEKKSVPTAFKKAPTNI